ncbi:M67 family metallopeptidase [Thermodesulfovibrio hydrogeniphilus]
MLRIKKEIFDEMIKHCIDCMPYEACGILAGRDTATEIYKIKNIERSSTSYFMEPQEQLKAMKDIRAKGLQMLSIYHSHPCGIAYPSSKDLQLAFYDVYYVIVGINCNDNAKEIFHQNLDKREEETVQEIQMRCFKLQEDNVKEIEIQVEQE